VRFADTKIGRLRRALQERGLLEDGVLILTSDHGENLVDHEPNFSHGKTLYDATLRILAAVRAPATSLRHGIEPAVFENVDVLPTLAALVGMPARSEWQGRAFQPEAPPDREPTFAQLERDFAARTARWKLVMHSGGARDYYRLDEDPGETRAATLPAEEEPRIAADFASWFEAHATPLYLEHARSIPAADLPSDVRDKLRALGYVQ
jgi:arylsulfatase A-like enzyme